MAINTSYPVAVIVGVGPGLGFSVAKRFASENFNVVLIARNKEQLQTLADELNHTEEKAFVFLADMANQESIISAFEQVKQKFKKIDVLIYNASSKFALKNISELIPDDFMNSWKICCLGGLLSAQQVLPEMLKNNKGTIIFTGATSAMRGNIGTAAFAAGKFSQRALAQSMARELGPKGIHVVHVIIDGQIATPDVLQYFPNRPIESFLNPNKIAEVYWQLYQQDKTVWTHEIDLRPAIEKF